jgi:peptidoglycan/xylan/chitin deacetylase (PgdA/CDA1 family)
VADGLRRVVAAATRGPVAAAGAGVLDRVIQRPPGVLTILTYHRVDEPAARPDLMPSLISATPASFAAQIAMVARHFDPVSLPDVLASLDDPARLPRRAVLVTFDDGYRDFATHAWPVLRAASVPATMFVATGAATDPSTPFWWDRLWAAVQRAPGPAPIATPGGALPVGAEHARRTVGTIRDWLKTLDHDEAMREIDRIVEELGARDASPPDEDPVLTVRSAPAVLGWDELRTLARDGLTLAPHTRHHPLLDRVALETAIEEIAGSHADLEREIGPLAPIPRVLAYPSGAHGGSAVTAAREAGMDIAMTTDRGGNDLRRVDRLRLRRINVGGRAGVPLIRAQLAWAAGLDARRSPD